MIFFHSLICLCKLLNSFFRLSFKLITNKMWSSKKYETYATCCTLTYEITSITSKANVRDTLQNRINRLLEKELKCYLSLVHKLSRILLTQRKIFFPYASTWIAVGLFYLREIHFPLFSVHVSFISNSISNLTFRICCIDVFQKKILSVKNGLDRDICGFHTFLCS